MTRGEYLTVELQECTFVAFSETHDEAVRLVRELKLQESFHMIRMYRNGNPSSLGRRVFAITSIDVCGF